MILGDAEGRYAERQGGSGEDSGPRMLLKTFRDGGAPVSVLVSFAAVRERPQRTGPGRSSRSQTAPTYGERTSTDLESVWTPSGAQVC